MKQVNKLKEKIKQIRFLNNMYIKMKWRERRICYGKENPDKVFYIIRRAPGSAGLFSYVTTNLGLIQYAVEKGYIPVIDMQNYENTYLEEEQIGKLNAWEFYFQQPCGYYLDDIEKSRNIILCGLNKMYEAGYPGYWIINNLKLREEWRRIAEKYLIVRNDILEETEKIFLEMFHGKKVLGVLCRGTDYLTLKPKEHPIQPHPDKVIEKVEEFINTNSYEYVYLATEDELIYEKFVHKFQDRLKVSKAKRFKDTGYKKLSDTEAFLKEDKQENGRNYLINILFLTKCDGLVAGCTGGTYGVLLLRNTPYEDEYIFDLGFYE